MRRTLTVISETFLLLRRDKVFLPVVTVLIFIIWFANLASYWGTEEYRKILYDIGTTGIDLTGALIAIFWGTKLIADSKREGSLELQLAAPVSRGGWVVGKFIGLSATLIFVAMAMILVWQVFLLLNDAGWMEKKHIIIFAFQALGWITLGSLAVWFASMAGQTTAMFCCACFWIVGLMTQNVAATLHDETPPLLRFIAENGARYWDFQRFNLAEYATLDHFVSNEELMWRAAYGLILCLLFVTTAAVFFTRKDVASQ